MPWWCYIIFIQGKNSSDEEDLNDVPDDDEYDSDDSFIDDAELVSYASFAFCACSFVEYHNLLFLLLIHNCLQSLPQDDYFQVDYSAVKHDGFFVNRGKLERTLVSLLDYFAFHITALFIWSSYSILFDRLLYLIIFYLHDMYYSL